MTQTDKPFRIGIAGLGTVGVGVVKILQTHADVLMARAGRPIEIISVTASSKDKDRGVDLSAYGWADTIEDLTSNDDIDCVLEMVGGSEGYAKELVEKSLKAGKHVVTANKALLAEHGVELAQLAEDNNVCLAYEAAVAGGIPIIKSLREGLAANDVQSIYGILNGTCNYILTEMRETGRDFNDVLKEAQEKGYAEADPTFDVDGIDAAHKLALLGALAFGVQPDFHSLEIKGIRNVTAQDIEYANELGYRIKLLGIAHHKDDQYMQSMEPCLVSKKSAIGNVEGVFNAVMTEGDFVGKTMIEGRGAGEGPTASSVVADIIDLAKGNGLPPFGLPVPKLKKVKWQGTDDVHCKCYIHFRVKDDAGVLADITTILKEKNISIDSVIQRGHDDDTQDNASIVIMTHAARFAGIKESIKKIEGLSSVLESPAVLRVEKL